MPDLTSDSKRLGYSQEDATARRLWDSQRSKANPWEHRGRQLDREELPAPTPAESAEVTPAEPSAPSVIAQQDRLRLQRPQKDVDNPFESLIAHQLHLKLDDQT